MSKLVVLKPRLSEKAYALSNLTNTYVFDIPAEINSLSVAESVKSQYGVNVAKVRIASVAGKPVRSVRKGGRSVRRSHRGDGRKAYVTLKEGDSLPLFAAVEDNKKPAKEDK